MSPTSLNFGNQNENTTSGTSTVSVTNTGTASVTISEVQAGGPFTVSGFSGSTTLSANQSLTLGVTFEPAAGSSYSDSLTITSTAPSSPNTVALSGTGVAPPSGGSGGGSGSGAGATTPPICGITNNTTDIVPNATSWANFTPPAVGGTYTDGGGYCPVTRVTNFKGNSANAGCHYYATESPLDISDAYLMLYDCNSGGWFVDAGPTNSAYSIGTTILSESALSGKWSHDSEPTWDRTTPGMFWVTINNSIESCTVNNSAKSVSCSINHTFSEYAGYRISFMDETDMTPDGWLVTVGQNTQGGHIDVFMWNPATQTKSPVYTTQCSADINSSNNGCIHKLIATPNDGVVIQFEGSTNPENGNELWESPWAALSPIELNSGGTGAGGQGGTDHFDTGKNSSGIEVANFEDFLNNPGPWGACQDGWRPTTVAMPIAGDPECLFDNSTNNPGWHVSWRGYPNTQFVVYSAQANGSAAEKFNNASGYAAPSTSNWNVYDNEIIMILVGSNNNPGDIYRLALSHTRGNPGYFWSDPRAAEGYSGNYVVFDSNSAWGSAGCGSDGGGDCSDVYIIK
ncbi:MAG: choice-of-anchor D domain-containing protein, partial [Candidatus Acidiferrales bacterium]